MERQLAQRDRSRSAARIIACSTAQRSELRSRRMRGRRRCDTAPPSVAPPPDAGLPRPGASERRRGLNPAPFLPYNTPSGKRLTSERHSEGQ